MKNKNIKSTTLVRKGIVCQLNKTQKGITLIALIITIIIMLILAGVILNLTIGERGIFSIAQSSAKKMEEEEAREKLELVLLDLQADKITDVNYNELEYINNKIKKNGMIVNGDIVSVNDWQFQIDRSVPKIVSSLGKGEKEELIGISITSTISNTYTKATISIEISYEKEITSILLNGENIKIPEKQNGKYIIEKEVTKNGTYSIIAKNIEGKYNIKSIKVSELTEDMNIYTAEDLVKFRNKVNGGATFEGKTVQLMNDIDLSTVCGETLGSWEPIGGKKNSFYGKFYGNYYIISGLYINTTKDYNGLFGSNYGYINGIILKEGEIVNGGIETGGIVGLNRGKIEKCCNYINISTNNSDIGGISGNNHGEIYLCINKGSITCKNSTKVNIGGISGSSNGYLGKGKIENCYNTGSIQGGNIQKGGIVGITIDNTGMHKNSVKNCYNIGQVIGSTRTGSITGANGGDSGYEGGTVENCYYLEGTSSKGIGESNNAIKNEVWSKTKEEMKQIGTELGNEFTDDINNINNGYPILKWQLENKH